MTQTAFCTTKVTGPSAALAPSMCLTEATTPAELLAPLGVLAPPAPSVLDTELRLAHSSLVAATGRHAPMPPTVSLAEPPFARPAAKISPAILCSEFLEP